MFARLTCMTFMAAALVMCCQADAQEKEKEKKKQRTGTVTGVMKSTKASPNGKNQIIEVLGVGEEKERTYRVGYDPKIKGPIPKVLEAVRAAKVGDRVRLEWIEGEGLNITAFEVLKVKKDN